MVFKRKSGRGSNLYLFRMCNIEGFADLTYVEYNNLYLQVSFLPLPENYTFDTMMIKLANELRAKKVLETLLDALDNETDCEFEPVRKSPRLNPSIFIPSFF